MPDHKKQHFVSLFYLKNFGNHNGTTINIFNITNNQLIFDGNLKGQCCRNYLYGKDGKIEHNLNVIETQAANLFSDILASRRLPERFSDQHFMLLSAVMLQWGRTTAAGHQLNELMGRLYVNALKEFYAAKAEEHAIDPKDLDELTIGYAEPERASLSLTAQMIPVAWDLDYRLLERRATTEFATSDNPVLLYNQFAHGRVPGCTTGFQAVGTQMFLPISKNYLLVFYDSNTYWLSDPKQPCISISEKDVQHLNLLQAINAYDNVYFSSNARADEITRTVRRSRLKRERSASEHRFIEKSEASEILHLYRNDINHCCIFQFNKMIRDMRTPLNGKVPERPSPNIKHFENVMKDYYAGKTDSYDLNNFFTILEKEDLGSADPFGS